MNEMEWHDVRVHRLANQTRDLERMASPDVSTELALTWIVSYERNQTDNQRAR